MLLNAPRLRGGNEPCSSSDIIAAYMSLDVGMRLGPYEILAPLGAGGMGEVYKARDTRLDRSVAIKSLPLSRAMDPERRARFAQEAKAASALNHPNIVTIYDVFEHDGRSILVMEFVEGKPLSELIPRHGFKLIEALRIGAQIAGALATAHSAGITHRDVKPSNIMVDGQGRVKVIDFGLAKLSTDKALAVEATTMTVRDPITEVGSVVGSVPYMSPEQAEGKPVDSRSDIFSFGSVLYEIVTGQPAFSGGSRASTLAAILDREPKPVSELRETLPLELERVITRCLRKDVSRRSQHMSDVQLALEELRDDSESGKLGRPAHAAPPSRPWIWPAIAGTVVIAAIFGVVWSYSLSSRPPKIGAANLVRVSPDDGHSYWDPAISADGKFVAFTSNRSGTDEIWLQQVGGGDPIQLTRDRGSEPQFAPDGTRIFYLGRPEGQNLVHVQVIPTLGGTPRSIAKGEGINYLSLSPDGTKITYFQRTPPGIPRMILASVDGTFSQRLSNWERTQATTVQYTGPPAWSPDGRYILALGTGRKEDSNYSAWDWFAIPVNGGDPVPTGAGALLRAAGFEAYGPTAFHGDGVLFSSPKARRINTWKLRLSPRTWRATGPPTQLTFGTEDESPSSITAGGVVAITSSKPLSDFYAIPVDPLTGHAAGPTRRMTQDGRPKAMNLLGGSANLMYFSIVNASNRVTRALYGLDLIHATQSLVAVEDISISRTISHDGRLIAYWKPDSDDFSIRIAEVGTPYSAARVLCQGCGAASRFSPDSHFLFIDPEYRPNPDPKRKLKIHLLDIASGQHKPWLEHPTASLVMRGVFGEKGDWVAINFRIPGTPVASQRMFVLPWRERPVPESEWIEVKQTGGQHTAVSNVLHFLEGNRLRAVKVDPARHAVSPPYDVKLIPGPQPSLAAGDSWAVRGSSIVFQKRETRSSVWLMSVSDEAR